MFTKMKLAIYKGQGSIPIVTEKNVLLIVSFLL